MKRALLSFAIIGLSLPAFADPAVVEGATARQQGDSWTFSVTVRHPDTGWDHYADGWRVEAPDGTELGYRKLLHPHETEQPFTRYLNGVTVPADLDQVLIRAHCNIDGWNSAPFVLQLDR